MNSLEHKKKAMLSAMEKTLGVVQEACIIAGIGRTTYYNWMNGDPHFKEEVLSMKDISLDFAESKLFESIEGVWQKGSKNKIYKTPPNVTAIIFYLKTQGKKRGYIERFQHEIQPVNKFADLTDEELKDRLARIKLKID